MKKKRFARIITLITIAGLIMTSCSGGGSAGAVPPAETVSTQAASEADPAGQGDTRPASGTESTGKEDEQSVTDTAEDRQAEAEAVGVKAEKEETGLPVLLGDERDDLYLPLLSGKRVALFSNQTGIVGNRILNKGKTPADTSGAAAEGSTAESADTADAAGRRPSAEENAAAAEGIVPFGKNADGTEAEYGDHILDVLISQGVDVEVVFSPEHGFRGEADAGEHVADSLDEQTGVPLRSLYGRGSKGPAAEDMELFDVLVVDIQDVGLRYYTYYITMYYLMDACAAAGKEVVILDRPNPNGFYMDGPVLEEEFASGVGKLPVPVVHGMTLGELAQMINGEGWLTSGKDACALTVIPCENYTHQTLTDLAVRPSPNLKNMRAVYLYASTCFFENTAFSVGRGTEFPFEVYGSPYLAEDPESEGKPEQEDGADKTGFSFTPVSMDGATAPPFEGQVCYGRDLQTIPIAQILQEGINPEYVIDAWSALQKSRPDISFFGTPDDSGRYWIDKLCGTDRVRHMIEEGCSAEEIKASWQEELEAFREQRRPYLLYKE